MSEIEAVLDRQSVIDSLEALASAMSRTAAVVNLPSIALGIDSSVFLRLAGHPKSEDIVDYLSARHAAPLILPGQAIQEFWNNQLAVVDTVSESLKKRFDSLKIEATKVDQNFGEFAREMERLLDEFSSEYGHVYDEATLRATSRLLEILRSKAFLSYVPRVRFHEMALSRKRTKTPPGFKDDGDGDFFVWLEFLYGLLRAKRSGQVFDHAVMLTNDKKVDWSRGGMAHPILSAEIKKLVGVSFECWTIDRLYTEINRLG